MQSASSSSIKESKSFSKSEVSTKGMERSESEAEQSLIDVEASVHHGDANESEQSLIADDTSDTVREDQILGRDKLKDANKLLKGKVGVDHNAKKWLEGCKELDDLEKSEVVIRLVYEVCLAKNIEYDLENDAVENEKENNKDRNFDTRRIFEILKRVNPLLLPQDRKKLVEFICRNGNVKLLEMICRQENKDGGGKVQIDQQYSWEGKFTGYDRLTDLLQYVLKQPCSPEIVICIAKKVYGVYHNVLSGKEYLENSIIQSMEERVSQPNSVVEECLKTAIKLGYKDVAQVMLSGDIYHCIRLMKGEKFQEGKKALDMIEKTVADVMSAWVRDERQSFKDDIQRLLKEGIEVDINKVGKKDLIAELEDRGINLSKDDKHGRVENLMEKLKGEEVKVKLILSKTVVGSLISTLFFNYQNELMEKTFKIEISRPDRGRREKEIDELDKKIDSKSFVKGKVLEKIKLLNSSSHVKNDWFFREVLAVIVNDKEKFNKLQAVCTAICKEKVEELLKGEKVHKGVADVLEFFGVESNQIKTSTPKKGHSGVSVIHHFTGDIENLVKGIRELNDPSLMACEVLEIAEGLASNKVPAFSGLSRRTIINLKSKKYGTKKSITKDRTKELEKAVNQILGEIKQGIDLLAKDVNGEYLIDIEDVFRHFQIINSEIEKKDKGEIVELVCRDGNVKLLEMICKQENKNGGGNTNVGRQYPWKGKFTGYDRLIDLLQYVLEQRCSSEIVLCIAKKVYGRAHILCNGKQYLDDIQVASIKGSFDYPDSVMEDCLKAAIELGTIKVADLTAVLDNLCISGASGTSSNITGEDGYVGSVSTLGDSGTQNSTDTALYNAVKDSKLAKVKDLIGKCSDINKVYENGNTLLHFAIERVCLSVFKELMKKNANVNHCNNEGNTPLHFVGRSNKLKSAKQLDDMAKQLIKKGANVNHCNREGNTPLHLAAERGLLAVVRTLLKSGATVGVENNDKKKPLDLVKDGPYDEMIKELLLDYGKQQSKANDVEGKQARLKSDGRVNNTLASAGSSTQASASDLTNISEGDKIISSSSKPSSAFGGARPKQNLGNSQQNVPKVKGLGKDKSVPESSHSSSDRSFRSKVGHRGSNPVEPPSTFREGEEKRRDAQKTSGGLQLPKPAPRSRSAESDPNPGDERRWRERVKPKGEKSKAAPSVRRGK